MNTLLYLRSTFAALALGAFALTGCQDHGAPSARALAQARARAATERSELSAIPPPSKSRYMSVRSYDNWENPYITVQPDMLTVHITYADANPSSFGAGGMLRPSGARRQQVDISPDKLGEAMTSVPQNSWPYGRVVGVEEPHEAPGKDELAMRRNVETTVALLSDLGLVAYDMKSQTLR